MKIAQRGRQEGRRGKPAALRPVLAITKGCALGERCARAPGWLSLRCCSLRLGMQLPGVPVRWRSPVALCCKTARLAHDRRSDPGPLPPMGSRLLGPARSSHGPPAVPLCRLSHAVGCFSGRRSFALGRPDPRTPCSCGARPSGLARGPVPLLVVVRLRCFGWLAGLGLLVRLLAARCLWLRAGARSPRAAGLLLLPLLWLLSVRPSSPPPVLVLPLSVLLLSGGRPRPPRLLRGAVRRLAARLVGAWVPPALRRSSARGWGWPLPGWVLLGLVRWPSPLLRC